MAGAQVRIFVVSLPGASRRRELLKEQFGEAYTHFEIVDAVDLRGGTAEYGEPIPPPCRADARRPMVGSEIGCALSHMAVYKKFLEEGSTSWAMIFEDDVLGSLEDLQDAIRIIQELPKDSFFLCGGLEGTNGSNYLYGHQDSCNLYRIVNASRRFMCRTCCYAVSRSVAHDLLSSQQRCLRRADEWDGLLLKSTACFYSPLFAHPLELSASSIELQRSVVMGARGTIKRVWSDGLTRTAENNIMKVILPVLARFNDSQRIGVKLNHHRGLPDETLSKRG